MSSGIKIQSAVITGATGVIGRALVDVLLKNGVRLLVIARKSESAKRLEALENTEVIYCDLNRLDSVDVKDNYDAFFHLGWCGTRGNDRFDEALQSENVAITNSAVLLAKRLGCKSFTGVGSQAEYGRVKEGVKLTPELEPHPETPYGKAKLKAMEAAQKLCRENGIKFCWCRVLSTYGIGDNPNNLVMYVINSCIKGEKCLLTPCEHLWDFNFSVDTANGLYLIAKNGKDGEVYVIGSGKALGMKEYINRIYSAVGNEKAELCFGAIDYYPEQVMYLCADISKLTRDTGYVPQYSFSEGIRKTVDYYKGLNR